ncbi:hypothetical protein L1987_01621 [Smallanthus sonchifolius]|uniref:Uncharacterized protein n=1 Tax=Smallanthus sonchifolius TaxID=185202 RepID=A0ACB9K5L4_9ASTR|nr:hypothetical protein L1987_01621 [Smallanthus sonchifolius]
MRGILVWLKGCFSNLVEQFESQVQKTESELEGDYLENYYKFVDESSILKHGGLNDQELEKIRHESEMLWVEFEKEHQEQCKSENTIHVASYETFTDFLEYVGFIFDRPDTPIIKDDYEIELLDLYLFVQAKGGCRAVCRNQKWQEIATHMGLPNHLDIKLRTTYMRYLDLIEYYHQNAKDRRDLEDNGNSGKDEVGNETTEIETANGSPKFKRRRVQAIRDFPPMCGPHFFFCKFHHFSLMEVAEPEAMKAVIEEYEEVKAIIEEPENQNETSSEELQGFEDDNSEDLVIITNDDFM